MRASKSHNNNHRDEGSALRIPRVWCFLIVVLIGSCMATTLYLADSVHSQLKESRVQVRRMRLKVLEVEKETQEIRDFGKETKEKTAALRVRAKQLASSLVGLSRHHRYAKFQLRNANKNVSKIQANFVLKRKSLEKQMNATLQQLRYHVIRGEQLKALLTKNGKERALVDQQLKEMQDAALLLSDQLEDSNKKLSAAAQVIRVQRSDISTLQGKLGIDTSSKDEKSNDGDLLPAGWTRHTDKKTGKEYFYNAETKKSSWSRPSAP